MARQGGSNASKDSPSGSSRLQACLTKEFVSAWETTRRKGCLGHWNGAPNRPPYSPPNSHLPDPSQAVVRSSHTFYPPNRPRWLVPRSVYPSRSSSPSTTSLTRLSTTANRPQVHRRCVGHTSPVVGGRSRAHKAPTLQARPPVSSSPPRLPARRLPPPYVVSRHLPSAVH